MKIKNIAYLLFASLSISFASCEKQYEDNLAITYYADIKINGDQTVFVPTGSTYNDAGAVATENGVEIEMETVSDVNTTKPGTYAVSYSAQNSDGYAKTVQRDVYVYDANVSQTDHSGEYLGDVVRNGTASYSGNPISLTNTGIAGVYYISDWIAGFYDAGRKLGAAYRFTGIMQINSSNEVIEISMSNPWGDPFDSVTGSFDPNTNSISYSAFWLDGTYEFAVKLVKQ